jgi:hypothetical protein
MHHTLSFLIVATPNIIAVYQDGQVWFLLACKKSVRQLVRIVWHSLHKTEAYGTRHVCSSIRLYELTRGIVDGF